MDKGSKKYNRIWLVFSISLLAGIATVIFAVMKRAASDADISADSAEWTAQGESNVSAHSAKRSRSAKSELSPYYGFYKITEFLPSDYWLMGNKYDSLPEQEADMMLGHIIEIGEDVFVSYDSFRRLGERDGRRAFPCNYEIENIRIENPEYQWSQANTDGIDTIGRSNLVPYLDMIQGKIEVPVAAPWGTQTYYVMPDGMLMFSDLNGEYFYLERLEQEPEQQEEYSLSEEEKSKVLQELMGTYVVTEFLPTKFYPANDSAGDIYLPMEEAELMVGKEVEIEENKFISYDNMRRPNSEYVGLAMDDFRLEQIEITAPDYQVEKKSRTELYGLKDDEMLREELLQDSYVEVRVFPGCQINGFHYLPEMYLLDDGKIMLYAMGEFFLLEREHVGKSEYEYPKMADIEVPYIPELEYHRSLRIRAGSPIGYVCWKDLLVIGDFVYRRENGIYKRTEEHLWEWFHMEEKDWDPDTLEQCENFLITQNQKRSKILIYDMDSKQVFEHSFDDYYWGVYSGEIYYRDVNEGIFRMDLKSGEREMVYADDRVGFFMIRENGDMLLMKGDRMVSDVIEFWLLSHDEQGNLSEKKIWETDEFEYIEPDEFNGRGLFMVGEYYDFGGELFCLKDNGEVETVVIEEGSASAKSFITEEGYFLWDSQLLSDEEKQEILFSWEWDLRKRSTALVDSISYYDFQGNKLDTWQLIDDEMLEAGYCLAHIVYGNGEIYAFYENEELDDLYISKVQVP